MGLKFYVSEVQGQINDAIRAKNKGQQAIEQLQSSISQFLSAPLSGKAYTSAKNYFQVAYTPLCRAAIMSGEALVSAHRKLLSEYQSTIGSIDTDEDQLLEHKAYLEEVQRGLERQINDAKTMRPDLERRYINAGEAIAKVQERIDKLKAYDIASDSFFEDYHTCQSQYNSGLAQVQNSKAWNSASGTFDLGLLDMSWATDVNERWNQRAQDLEKKQKELEMKMGFSNPKYEIRSVPGPYGEDIYEVYVNGVLDQEATTQYNLDRAIVKRDAILNAKWSTSDKVIAGVLFLVGVTIATGGASAVITGILGVFEGSGSVLVALSNGTTALIPAVAVNKDALVQTAEGAVLAVGGILAVDQSVTIMASNGNMLGENGTQTTSTTTWKNGKTERIDVENPNPGKRPGDVHYHEPNNTKWRYDVNLKKFVDEVTGDLAPSRIQKLLNKPEIKKAIEKGLKYLGE